MGIVMGVTAGVSTAVTVAQAYNQSEALKAEGEYNQKISNLNAKFNDLAAEDAIERGKNEATRKGQETRQLIGRQRALAAAQGISADTGSIADIISDTAKAGSDDVMTITNNAYREAYGYKSQAGQLRMAGDAARSTAEMKAKNTLVTGGLQGLNTMQQAYYYNSKGSPGKSTTPSTGKGHF